MYTCMYSNIDIKKMHFTLSHVYDKLCKSGDKLERDQRKVNQINMSACHVN